MWGGGSCLTHQAECLDLRLLCPGPETGWCRGKCPHVTPLLAVSLCDSSDPRSTILVPSVLQVEKLELGGGELPVGKDPRVVASQLVILTLVHSSLVVGGSTDSRTPRSSQVQRLQSCISTGRAIAHSTPARRSSGPTSQSLLSSRGTPTSARRVSALPTPGGWRLSGLPLMTPKTLPRALASPLCAPAQRLSSEPQRRSAVRTEPRGASSGRAGGRLAGLSPSGSPSPPPSVPQALHFSPEKNESPFSGDFTGAAQVEAKPGEDTCPGEALLIDIGLGQLTITPQVGSRPPADLPLIDFCSPPEADVALGSASRPLIDLTTNTPDVNRNCVSKNSVSKPLQAEGQLIDLGSPLVQLSPEADKENVDSPLLKF
ncbi:G2 and S phase-expressed protein 1 [Urocitellus parryii]